MKAGAELWTFIILLAFCGVSIADGQYAREVPRVIGGVKVEAGDAPFAVSISVDGKHNCGGALLAPTDAYKDPTAQLRFAPAEPQARFVVTAAHCLFYSRESIPLYERREDGSYSAPRVLVYTGSLDINEGGEYRSVEDVRVHNEYEDTSIRLLNDIAVLKISPSEQDPDSSRQSSIRLPISGENWALRPYLRTSIVGWGRSSSGVHQEDHLMAATLPTVDNEHCVEVMGKLGIVIEEKNICAGYYSGEKDSCKGDSGGPLFYRLLDDSVDAGFTRDAVLIGIVSGGGRGCGMIRSFGFYSDAWKYTEWIAGVIEEME